MTLSLFFLFLKYPEVKCKQRQSKHHAMSVNSFLVMTKYKNFRMKLKTVVLH